MRVTEDRLAAIERYLAARALKRVEVRREGGCVVVSWDRARLSAEDRAALSIACRRVRAFEPWEVLSGFSADAGVDAEEELVATLRAAGFAVNDREFVACGVCGSEHVPEWDGCSALFGDVVGDLAADLRTARSGDRGQ